MNESMPPAGNTPSSVVHHTPRFAAIELLVLIAALGFGGWYWFTQRSAPIPTIPLADEAPPLDLRGLDEPQAINGTCVKSFTVFGIRGDERFNDQKFALTVQLVGNPADEPALAQLLASATCAEELKTVEGTVKTKLGLEKSTAEQFTTSFRSRSGHRLFLP